MVDFLANPANLRSNLLAYFLSVFLPLPADVKFYGCAKVDDAYWRPPEESDIIGCIVSIADDAKTVIDNIKETAGALEDSKVSVDVRSFADLLEEIESAGKHGIDFTNNKMPTAESVL
jgi:hypothetical protein